MSQRKMLKNVAAIANVIKNTRTSRTKLIMPKTIPAVAMPECPFFLDILANTIANTAQVIVRRANQEIENIMPRTETMPTTNEAIA